MNDPVLSWLKQRKLPVVSRWHETRVAVESGSVRIRSNAHNIIRMIQEEFRFYDRTGSDSPMRLCLDVEAYRIGFEPGGEEPRADASIDLKIDLDGPCTSDCAELDEIACVNIDGNHCLWRFPNLLVTLPDDSRRPIRILATNAWKAPSPSSLRLKGNPSAADNAVEVLDLIKMLYIRRNGFFCMHGAVLVLNNWGILITGASGVGKTTTALALLREGFTLLSDELIMFAPDEAGTVRVRGLLLPPAISGGLPGGLGALESILDTPPINGKSGYRLAPAERAGAYHPAVPPVAIFFLQKALCGQADHRVEKMSRQDAFIGLMEQALDLSNHYQRELRTEAIIGLANACPAYRLFLGRGLLDLPRVIRRHLQVGP